MKRFIFLLLISCSFSACIPTPPGGGGGARIKAKLVRVTGASIVIQILDSRYYHLGETWSDTNTPPVTYEHVAKVSNPCEFPTETIAVGSEFFFKIDANPRTDCVVCAMWDAPPTKEIAVTVVP